MTYGFEDTSYQAAHAESGIKQLVIDFYRLMAQNSDYKTIYQMHPDDIEQSIDKLYRFLCGWLGGPKHYQKKYGSINIPAAHQHLAIGAKERDQWLSCMQQAIAQQPYPDEFKQYLITQLTIPANAIYRRCAHNVSGAPKS